MCIRDRYVCYRKVYLAMCPVHSAFASPVGWVPPAPSCFGFLGSLPGLCYYRPVSYTHLDVYKRQGILRVGGRLQHSQLSYASKHQIILHPHSHLSKLITENEHLRLLHSGVQLTQLSLIHISCQQSHQISIIFNKLSLHKKHTVYLKFLSNQPSPISILGITQ